MYSFPYLDFNGHKRYGRSSSIVATTLIIGFVVKMFSNFLAIFQLHLAQLKV